MSGFYELWDLDTGNMIGDFTSEADALVAVDDLVSVNTPSFADLLSLGHTSEEGTFRIVAQGRPLAARAHRAMKARVSQSTPVSKPRASRVCRTA